MTDLATRVYNHTWKIDPIVRSVLDTDFYKLLMAQTIFRRHAETKVTFGLVNRATHIPLAKVVDHGALKEQLDHIRTLSLTPRPTPAASMPCSSASVPNSTWRPCSPRR